MTDQISDMLVILKNANRARRASATVPYSRFKEEIAKCLQRHGYLKSVSKKTSRKFHVLEMEIERDDDVSKISGAKRISKPSRRLYLNVGDIKPVKSGHGLLVLSTPKGVLTGREARRKSVGGEALFEIW